MIYKLYNPAWHTGGPSPKREPTITAYSHILVSITKYGALYLFVDLDSYLYLNFLSLDNSLAEAATRAAHFYILSIPTLVSCSVHTNYTCDQWDGLNRMKAKTDVTVSINSYHTIPLIATYLKRAPY